MLSTVAYTPSPSAKLYKLAFVGIGSLKKNETNNNLHHDYYYIYEYNYVFEISISREWLFFHCIVCGRGYLHMGP